MTPADREAQVALTGGNEGFRSKPYRCPAGKLTIGYGLNLDAGIDKEEARWLLERRLLFCRADLATFPWFESLGPVCQRALVDMRYQLGAAGFRGFTKMIACLARGDREGAADAALDSKYARVDSPARAQANAHRIRTNREP